MATIGQQVITPDAGWQRIDDRNVKIIYSPYGNWGKAPTASYYNSTSTYTTAAGSTISFKFKGTKLRLYLTRYTTAMPFTVSIDGVIDNVSTVVGSVQTMTLTYEKTGLSDTIHTVVITNAAASPGGMYFDFDCLDIDNTGYMVAQVGTILTDAEPGWTRYDSTDASIMYGGAWSSSDSSSYYGGSCKYVGAVGATAAFNFTGTSIRLTGYTLDPATTGIDVIIDGVTTSTTEVYPGGSHRGLWFERTGLDNKEHTVIIKKTGTDTVKFLYLDAIDIDASGLLLPYNLLHGRCKVDLSNVTSPGDYVWCKYIATSGAFGTFSDLATKKDIDVKALKIPVASSTSPNGYFKFIFVGYDHKGRKKFVADRNIQQGISWDTLNTGGVASASGIPVTIDGKENVYTVKLLSGGIASTDKDNEWDKIITEYSLGAAIIAGDNTVWNWSGVWTLASTVHTSTGGSRIIRGNSVVAGQSSITTSDTTVTNTGFRPVLLADQPKNRYLFYKEDGSVYKYSESEMVEVTGAWSNLTESEKVIAYQAGTMEMPPVSSLATLGKYKIMTFTEDSSTSTLAGSISAVPKDRVVVPKGLISLDGFDGIDSAMLAATLLGSGAVVVAVTTDLTTYKVFSNGAWLTIDITDVAAFKTAGMTPATLASLTISNWNALTSGKQGIGFAYLPTIKSLSDVCNVDKLALVVDMKGSWDKAVYGTDFTYGYPKNNLLRVKLLTNGDYKINYHESAN